MGACSTVMSIPAIAITGDVHATTAITASDFTFLFSRSTARSSPSTKVFRRRQLVNGSDAPAALSISFLFFLLNVNLTEVDSTSFLTLEKLLER